MVESHSPVRGLIALMSLAHTKTKQDWTYKYNAYKHYLDNYRTDWKISDNSENNLFACSLAFCTVQDIFPAKYASIMRHGFTTLVMYTKQMPGTDNLGL